MNLRKTVSLKKREANRRNGLKSTGPKTPRGKMAVRCNAITGGLFAKHVLIMAGDGEENKAEFEALLKDFRQRFLPVDAVESALVEKMAVCFWRHRRVLRYETGEIRGRLDSAKYEEEHRRSAQVGTAFARLNRTRLEAASEDLKLAHELRASIVEFSDLVNAVQKTSGGLKGLIDLLEYLKLQTMESGTLTKSSQDALILNFGIEDRFHVGVIYLCESRERALQQPENPADPEHKQRLFEIYKSAIVRRIERKQVELGEKIKVAKHYENLALDAKLASLSQPSEPVMDAVMRAIASLDREFYRALNQLERLQRQRKGETVPPPMSVSLN